MLSVLATVLAMTERERLAIIAGVFGVLAGAPAVVAAVITARTRRENRDQHAEGQSKIDRLAQAVTANTTVTGELKDQVERMDEKVDRHGEQISVIEALLPVPVRVVAATTAPGDDPPTGGHQTSPQG